MSVETPVQPNPKLLKYGIIAVIVGLLVIAGIWYFMKYVGASNEGNEIEQQIKAQYKAERAVQGQFFTKMMELAQVRKMAIDDQERLIKAVFGPDGRSGNQAAMQWIKEQNPAADISVTKQLAQIIEGSRNKFANLQITKFAMCQSWETKLGYFVDGYFYAKAGYPNKVVENDWTIKKMCTPIESDASAATFDTFRDNGMDLGK